MFFRSGVLAVILTVAAVSTAHAGWREPIAGPLDASAAQHARGASSTVLDGVPYVAWLEGGSVHVSRLATSGWERVGEALGSAVGFYPTIGTHAGSVVVAWKPSGSGIALARLGAGGWEPLPPLGDQFSYAPSIASAGGELYVGYQQNEADQEDVRVVRLAAGAWQPVGGVLDASERDQPLLPQLGEPDQGAVDPVLAAAGDQLYAGWIEAGAVRVARLDGTTWPLVGGAATTTGSPAELDLAVAGGIPYVAWRSATGRFDVHVARFDGSGWAEPAAAMAGDAPDVAAIGGAPWLSWRESGKLRVARLDASDTAWEQLSTAVNRQSAWSAGALTDVDGIPFIAYAEGPTSAAQDVRVSRLEPEFQSTTATARGTDATLVTRLVTFGLPYPVWFDVAGALTASQTSSGDPADVTTTVSGLAPRTTYSATPYAAAGAGPQIDGPPVSFTTTKRNGK